jgi:hypothetical protein
VGGLAQASNNSSSHQNNNHQRSGASIPGLKLPSSWHDFEVVPGGSYVFGQDSRLQQFEFALNDDEVSSDGSMALPWSLVCPLASLAHWKSCYTGIYFACE